MSAANVGMSAADSEAMSEVVPRPQQCMQLVSSEWGEACEFVCGCNNKYR